jgi:competence protein ComEC
MHLTSIAACVVLLLRRWPRRTVPALFLSLTLYTGMVGDVESLTRAYVMALLLMAAHATIRPARPLDALGRTLMLMTLAAPLSILSAGLQLSCAATFALLVVLPRLRRPDGAGRARAGGRAWARAAAGAARSVRNALVVSAAVEAFIAPLQIHHFGAVSAVGPLATVAFLVPVTVVLLAAIPVAVMPPWVPLADESARALAALSAWTVDLVGAVGVRAPALVALDRPHAVLYYAALAAAWRWRRRWYGWVLGLGGLAAAFAIGG